MAQTLMIYDNAGQSHSYLGGTATISPNGFLNVPLTQLYPICKDSQLVEDCSTLSVYLSDGVNFYYTSTDCLNYLSSIANSLGGAVVGYVGAPTPNFAILVGGRDPSGNTKLGAMDTSGGLVIAGEGTTGSPAGGLLSIQGTTGMTPVSISSKTSLIYSSPTSVSVGISSTSVLSSNASRLGCYLTNTSSNTISISIGGAAVANSGIVLFPGGSFWMDEYSFSTAAITAIASAASSNLAVQEIT